MSGETGFGLTGSGAEPLEDDDPRRIGAIPLLGRLGAGGMGRVYLGVHEGRYAAVKQVLPSVAGEDKDFLRRFGHELDNLSRLPSDATAPLLAGDRDAGPPWFATAYVPGITLREAVDLHGPLPAEALWLILREAATGLAAVHALDMVHRDLKPSNAMLTLDGLTLIDFGVARAAEQSQVTRTGMVVGTPAYMSPEQASGKRASSGVVDVFALGSLIAYAASGRPPFGDESGHAVLYRIVHEDPDLQPLRDLDPELADVVASCLDKDHEGRPTAAELVERASGHGPSAAPLWPRAITERLSERAAFAARPPEPEALDLALLGPATKPDLKPDLKPVPEADPKPKPDPAAEPRTEPEKEPDKESEKSAKPEKAAAKPEKAGKERRRRILPVFVPVVVVATGTTLAFQLLPHVTDSGDATGAGPSSSVTVSATTTPSGTAGGSAKPSPSPSTSASTAKEPESEAKESATATGAAGAGAGSGSDADDTAAKDEDGAGTDSGGSGSGAGGGDGSGAGGDSSGTAPKPPSTGGFTLRNASHGQCLNGTGNSYYGNVGLGSCDDAQAAWSLQGAHVVHKDIGNCLSTYGALHLQTCGADRQNWRLGSGDAVVNTDTGKCLEASTSGTLLMRTCTGTAAQRWTRSA
ncbi:serine/threonine protein kinase [Streptomyces sp. AC512_CC834]|uniref:serine/threonine protein kinase n=1 Tax=Streptomyces sp. AC512_CC834 TaxID=2823691 RepID=UPI001C251B6F|nr:serine/threonine protein kinase [Streptomyces sp. AC512_CC834]